MKSGRIVADGRGGRTSKVLQEVLADLKRTNNFFDGTINVKSFSQCEIHTPNYFQCQSVSVQSVMMEKLPLQERGGGQSQCFR